MNMKHVELFRHIMRFGTLTHAAEIMAVSQPAASKMLNQLERSTGIALFERSKGRLKPTRDGELFFAEVQKTWQGIERLERISKDIRRMRFGHLNIGILPSLGGTLMPPLLARFRQDHGNTTISMNAIHSERVTEWAIAGQIDIGLVNAATAHGNIDCRLMGRIPGVAIMPTGHVLTECTSLSPRDLEGHDFISLGQFDRSMVIDKVFDDAGVNPRIAIEAHMAHTTCALVASGAGVGIVDELSAKSFLGRGLEIRPFTPQISFPIWYLRSLNLGRSALADALTRDIELEFERLGYRVPQ